MIDFHAETLEQYNEYLLNYDIQSEAEIYTLPKNIYEMIILSEFNRVCEDRHYALDFDTWRKENSV